MFLALPLSLLAFSTSTVVGLPLAPNRTHAERATHATSVILNEEKYINKGLVAFGPMIPTRCDWFVVTRLAGSVARSRCRPSPLWPMWNLHCRATRLG
ncbi:hypothetical protein EDB87DRAFT_1615596 [Lactarius vividus]|nr:hypothetical protein EDB87DRAFT_1615596 [Lactarius vividus]